MRSHIIALSLALLGLVAPSCDPLPPSGDGDPGTSTGHDGSTSTPAGTTTDPMSTSVDGTSGGDDLPPAPDAPQLSFSQVKQFDFSWPAVAGADYYRLLESAAPGEPFQLLGGDIAGGAISFTMPLHFRYQASYRLRACNVAGCAESMPVSVVGSLVEAIGYFKASNTDAEDEFGFSVALSEDGSTLVVGAPKEDSSATGVGGNEADDSMLDSGAVYVFVRDGMDQWSQQAYVKASNPGEEDYFGWSVALSGNGNILAVGAPQEDSAATGIDGDQLDDAAPLAGAVYVFVRDGMGRWSQQAYVKASNAQAADQFGNSVASSSGGDTLAVGAPGEASSATGIDGNQVDDSASLSGAAYVFERDGMDQWSQQAYVKASNAGADDQFGYSIASSSDGNTLAVGARGEASSATGIDGNQADDSASLSGAAYVFVRDGMDQWSQQAYVKASNTEAEDEFGAGIVLSGDGDTLAVGATGEDGKSLGINGDQDDRDLNYGSTGAAYVFVRDGGGQWSQQAYVKASNTGRGDRFGASLDLSSDGELFTVGAWREEGNTVGVGGNEQNDTGGRTGAVYVFARDGLDQWSQQAYVKASNIDPWGLDFGISSSLSGDGSTLAVGAPEESSNATGIGGDQAGGSANLAGAVYVY